MHLISVEMHLGNSQSIDMISVVNMLHVFSSYILEIFNRYILNIVQCSGFSFIIVSQTQASEEIQRYGLSVVGWYHSHPTFEPNPSVRDIETQLKFQVDNILLSSV